MRGMKTALVVALGTGLCASMAMAHPNPKLWNGKATKAARATHTYGPMDGVPYTDNFDTYAAGSGLIGQGGWQGWAGTVPAPEGYVVNNQSATAPNSLRLRLANPILNTQNTDVVQVHAIAGGKWIYSAMTYSPTGATGTAYFILLHTYPAFAWSLDMALNQSTNMVSTLELPGPGGAATPQPIVRDQWIPVRAEIDLDAFTLSVFYNNQPVTTNIVWGTGTINTLQCLDLYSDSTDEFYYDNIKLAKNCYPDCNGDGNLNIADFGCFQTAFATGNMYADCNGDGNLNLADFGCFQTKFAIGCP